MGKRKNKKRNKNKTKSEDDYNKKSGPLQRQDMMNEVDEFIEKRDKIDLMNTNNDNDSDSDIFEGQELALEYEEASSSSADNSENDDEEYYDEQVHELLAEDEEEDYQKTKMKSKKELETIDKQWGKRKKEYYDADTKDFELHMEEDMEIAKEEEEEAMRLQKERAKELDDGDFGLADVINDDVSNKKKKKKKKKKQDSDDELDINNNNDVFDSTLNVQLDLGIDENGNKNENIERVTRDLSKLTSNDKLELLIKDSPELLNLLEDLKSKINDLNNNIKPLLDRLSKAELPTNEGVSFLELKFQLLLNYCINIVFYLLMKAEGKSVKNHPVVEQLVELRTMIEKIKPIDQKMKYQIDKILRAGDEQETIKQSVKQDPLKYKPNINDLEENNNVNDNNDSTIENNGKYIPPKLVSTPFNDKASRKREKSREKDLQKLASSSFMNELANEMSERPEEYKEDEFGSYGKSEIERALQARENFEEENFMRLVESKKVRKLREKASKLSSNPWDELGDLAGLDNIAEQTDEVSRLREQMNKRANERNSKRKLQDQLSDSELEEAESLYNQQEQVSKRAKKAREEKYAVQPAMYAEKNPDRVRNPDGRRQISRQILTNRGLARYRNPELKNPRVRRRKQYEKALVKRRRGVQEYQEQQYQSYGGQKTGISKTTVRSTNLQS